MFKLFISNICKDIYKLLKEVAIGFIIVIPVILIVYGFVGIFSYLIGCLMTGNFAFSANVNAGGPIFICIFIGIIFIIAVCIYLRKKWKEAKILTKQK